MDNYDALVAIHGYSPEGMEGGRDPVEVWDDRLETGYEVAQMLDNWGAEVAVAISGGGDFSGKTEAQVIEEYAREEKPEITRDYHVRLEDRSETTKGNVEQLYGMADELDVSSVFTVSSRDHAPRVLRDWEQFLHEKDNDLFVSAVGGGETYASSGKSPFIMEAAMFEPFVDAFNEVWNVTPESYEQAAEEVEEVLRKYQ